jgi:Zn ribbon nucleic-acid-binding protein
MSLLTSEQVQSVHKISSFHTGIQYEYSLTTPVKLGSFTVTSALDAGESKQKDGSSLRVLKLPPHMNNVFFDLENGYEMMKEAVTAIQSTEQNDLNHILRWIIHKNNTKDKQMPSEIESITGRQLCPDFIATKQVFAQVLRTPFEKEHGWCIAVSKYMGTIFMIVTEERVKKLDEKYLTRQYYADHRFKRYISEASACQPDVIGHLSSESDKSSYCCIVQSEIAGHILVYSGSMDCIDKEAGNLSLTDFIDIRTTDSKVTADQLLHWWSENSLMGTEKVICGFRGLSGEKGDEMIVRKIEAMNVSDMERITAAKKRNGKNGKKKSWSRAVCHQFLTVFLDFVQETATEDDPDVVYMFEWHPGKSKALSDTCVTVTKTIPTDGKSLIPKWFIDCM